MTQETAILIAAVIAALVSALSAVLAYQNGRRQIDAQRELMLAQSAHKVAEFRQNWINELRECLSTFQSIGTTPEIDPRSNPDFYKMGTKIELLMNPLDEDYASLKDVMYKYLDSSDATLGEKYANNPEFVDVSQRILKREWDRLKNDVRENKI